METASEASIQKPITEAASENPNPDCCNRRYAIISTLFETLLRTSPCYLRESKRLWEQWARHWRCCDCLTKENQLWQHVDSAVSLLEAPRLRYLSKKLVDLAKAGHFTTEHSEEYESTIGVLSVETDPFHPQTQGLFDNIMDDYGDEILELAQKHFSFEVEGMTWAFEPVEPRKPQQLKLTFFASETLPRK